MLFALRTTSVLDDARRGLAAEAHTEELLGILSKLHDGPGLSLAKNFISRAKLLLSTPDGEPAPHCQPALAQFRLLDGLCSLRQGKWGKAVRGEVEAGLKIPAGTAAEDRLRQGSRTMPIVREIARQLEWKGKFGYATRYRMTACSQAAMTGAEATTAGPLLSHSVRKGHIALLQDQNDSLSRRHLFMEALSKNGVEANSKL